MARTGAALFAFVIVSTTLVATACRPAEQAAEQPKVTTTLAPKPGGKIVYGIEADPNGLDPTRNAWDPSGLLVANALFDTMTAFDAEGTAQPYLMESFAHNADYTEWTGRARKGVTYSNGTPFNADAIIRWFASLSTSLVTGQAASTSTA